MARCSWSSVQAPVDLVEVTENLLAELCVSSVQPIEATVDGREPLVDRGELPAEELDELLGLTGTHAALLLDDGDSHNCLCPQTADGQRKA
jgi:hypothetical protein